MFPDSQHPLFRTDLPKSHNLSCFPWFQTKGEEGMTGENTHPTSARPPFLQRGPSSPSGPPILSIILIATFLWCFLENASLTFE